MVCAALRLYGDTILKYDRSSALHAKRYHKLQISVP